MTLGRRILKPVIATATQIGSEDPLNEKISTSPPSTLPRPPHPHPNRNILAMLEWMWIP